MLHEAPVVVVRVVVVPVVVVSTCCHEARAPVVVLLYVARYLVMLWPLDHTHTQAGAAVHGDRARRRRGLHHRRRAAQQRVLGVRRRQR